MPGDGSAKLGNQPGAIVYLRQRKWRLGLYGW
jgi:hypothetical protein